MWCLFGGNGWIGSQFREILEYRRIKYDVPSFRMDDMEAVEKYMKEHKPERVISFIGRTHGGGYSTIDYLELGRPQLVENVRDNLFAPVAVAILCQKYNIHFTYLGTGCIFQYEKEEMERVVNENMRPETGIYDDDLPNFFGSSYSIVKGYTDQLMHLMESTTLNLRIRMPITNEIDHPRNFICKILKYEKICSIQNSMTVLDDMLPIIFDMIKQKRTGTFNMCNPDTISHNEILDMYIKYIDPEFTYNNFTKEEQEEILKADRSNNYLETSKLESYYWVPHIQLSLETMFQKIAEKNHHVPERCLKGEIRKWRWNVLNKLF
jgi:3,5-epimerase/4-reductase